MDQNSSNFNFYLIFVEPGTGKLGVNYVWVIDVSKVIRADWLAGLRRSRVPSRPAGRDPGRDGTGFFKGIFEKTRPLKTHEKFINSHQKKNFH